MPPKVQPDKILGVLSRSPKSWLATFMIVERTGLSLTVVSARLRELADSAVVEKRVSPGESRATSHEWRLKNEGAVAA